MVRITWTSQARDDLKSIAEYISLDSVKYAKLQVSRIKARTKILKSYLRIGNIVPEINDENVRELVEGNYRIIYRILSDKQVDIVAIHHIARDLTRRTI